MPKVSAQLVLGRRGGWLILTKARSGKGRGWQALSDCPLRCGHKEAVFFQSHSARAEVSGASTTFWVILVWPFPGGWEYLYWGRPCPSGYPEMDM